MKVSRDPSDMRGGEALVAAMDVHFLPAHGAALRRAAARCGAEGAQKLAVLANDVPRNIHYWGFSWAPRSLNVVLAVRTLLSMGIALNDEIRRLLDGRHFAVLATINPDGGPQTSAMWVGRDSDEVLFSTVAGRRKHRNLERDPRASVTVIDSEDPYNYVELRGHVTTIEEDVGRAFDTGLSWKYDGRDPDPDRPGAVRLILRMTVEKATGYAAVGPK